MVKIKARSNIDLILKSLKRKEELLSERGIAVDAGLKKIGDAMVNEAKKNLIANRAIMNGQLLNSIQYRIFTRDRQRVLEVGTFGALHASVVEFGSTNMHPGVRRALFKKLAGAKRPSKNIINWKARTYMARPYWRPAWDSVSPMAVRFLQEIFKEFG